MEKAIRAYSSSNGEVDNKLSRAMIELDSIMSVKAVDMTITDAFVVGKHVFSAMESVRKARKFIERYEN